MNLTILDHTVLKGFLGFDFVEDIAENGGDKFVGQKNFAMTQLAGHGRTINQHCSTDGEIMWSFQHISIIQICITWLHY